MQAVGVVRSIREEGSLAMLSLEVIQEDEMSPTSLSKFCSPTSACLKLWGRRAHWAVHGGVLLGDVVVINGGRHSLYRTYSSDFSIVGSSFLRILFRLKDACNLNSSSCVSFSLLSAIRKLNLCFQPAVGDRAGNG